MRLNAWQRIDEKLFIVISKICLTHSGSIRRGWQNCLPEGEDGDRLGELGRCLEGICSEKACRRVM